MARRFSGNGAGSPPRARTIAAAVPSQAGTLVTIGSQGLLAPVSYGKTSGAANLSIGAASGVVSAAAAIAAGTSQSVGGTIAGADGCIIPFALTVTAGAAVPAAPAIALTAGVGQITIFWTDAGNGGSPITAHNLYRGTSAGAEALVGTVASASPYIDSALTAGQPYFYRLSAVNAIGEGPLSAEQSAAPTSASGLTIASLSRPALALPNFYNAVGDSMTAGLGVPANSNFDYPAQLRTLITTDTVSGFHFSSTQAGTAIHKIGNGGQSGQNTTTIANAVTGNLAAYPSENARTTIFMGSINDYNALVSGWARDWPAQVRTNTANAAAAITGGDGMWSFLTIPENGANSGMRYGADHRFHFHDMVATRGRKVVDVQRYMRMVRKLQGITPGTADDWAVGTMSQVPYSYRGGANDFDGSDHPATSFTNNTSPYTPTVLTAVEGEIWYNTFNNSTYRKIGASGAGSWDAVDIKHFSKWGYAVIARLAGDVLAAVEGIGPPFVPPARMRCAADAAAGAALGRLLPTGTVTQYALRYHDDTPVTAFAVDGSGNVTRTASGTLTEGVSSLIVVAANANGALLSPLDIFVTRPATATAPQMRTIAAPGISVAARDAHGMADGSKLSGAMWIKTPAAGVAAQYVYCTRTSTPAVPISVSINGSGFFKLQIYDNTNTFVLNSQPSNTLSPNTVYWVTWALDFATNTKCIYFNEAPATFAPTLPTATIPLADCNPLFLASASAKEFYLGALMHTGQIGFFLFTDGYIDWTNAANRRLLYDASLNPVSRTPYSAIGGVNPRFELWGGVGDWMWGSPDGSYGPSLLSVSHKAITLLS